MKSQMKLQDGVSYNALFCNRPPELAEAVSCEEASGIKANVKASIAIDMWQVQEPTTD